MSQRTRRVVTGHDDQGRSVVLSDDAVPHMRVVGDGAEFHEIWATSGAPAPITGSEPEPTEAEPDVGPPAGGTRIRIVVFPPGSRSPMHRTETVDYGIVLSGTLELLLDDGSSTPLGAGDVVVQRGTDHAWVNSGEKPCEVAFVLVDGEFAAGVGGEVMAQPPSPA